MGWSSHRNSCCWSHSGSDAGAYDGTRGDGRQEDCTVKWWVVQHRPSTLVDRDSDPAPGPPHRAPPCYRVPPGAPQPSRCHAPASWAAAGTNRCIDTLVGASNRRCLCMFYHAGGEAGNMSMTQIRDISYVIFGEKSALIVTCHFS